jgi:hypothetical protein
MLLKIAVFWDVTPCGSCKNRRFEERITTIIRVKEISELGIASAESLHPDDGSGTFLSNLCS